MELRYIIMTIIKILISVPTILLASSVNATPSALMGGHLDNISNSTNLDSSLFVDYDLYDNQDITSRESNTTIEENASEEHENKNSEEIPDPSALVVPGYNLPENIFNKGKPFYLERDPLTGAVDFDSKSPLSKVEDYDYAEDDPKIYDKSSIDRKDSISGSHRPSDVNQLVPNFHDFLNLPVKYNSDKYVAPLISSSYANTKVQGNVNKQYNHKEYTVTTYKPTASPTYYLTTKPPRYETTSSTTPPTTTRQTTKEPPTTTAQNYQNIYLTTENINNIYLTTRAPSSTTKRVISFFEQLFGEYEDPEPTEPPKPPAPTPQLFMNLPSNKNKDFVEHPSVLSNNSPNVLSGSNMGIEPTYEYEDEYSSENIQDNIAVESKVHETTIKPANVTENVRVASFPTTTLSPEYFEYDEIKKEVTTKSTSSSTTTTTTTTQRPTEKTSTTTTTTTTERVLSMPLGENHIINVHPSFNLHQQLKEEKVQMQHVPSTSSIHIAHDQDTVSFVVGNHHNIESNNGGKYVGSVTKENPVDPNRFRPFYNEGNQNIFTLPPKPKPVVQNIAPFAGSSVTIQPLKNSEASLAIGVPVNAIKKVPGQVMDEKLEINTEKKPTGSKIVFPNDNTQNSYVTDLLPPPKQQNPNREILKLNSKPMFHQLPSDLTPPNELDVSVPNRLDRPRPPWDPRPGHFYSGRPEYARPPRPPPGQDSAYKRVDNLPNILPQFRPNASPHRHYEHQNKNYMRQPLLDRPNNRPVGFFEKLQPPPPPKNLHNLRKLPTLEQRNKIKTEEKYAAETEKKPADEPFPFLKTPPQVVLANRRNDEESEIETLQMIQAKNAEKKDSNKEISLSSEVDVKEEYTEKPLYVVYPVNTAPLKLDVLDTNKKEAVVIGTRAELPLPPSKINNDFKYDQDNLFNKDRNDSPILKPHVKPIFPVKSDFPYPLEKPDPSLLNPPVPEVPNSNGNSLEMNNKYIDDAASNNQWNRVGLDTESRVVTGSKINAQNNQISVTLKTYTEKPIAVAYTPTESYSKHPVLNYGNAGRPDTLNAEIAHGISGSEVTLGAIMHTRPQPDLGIRNRVHQNTHKIDSNPDTTHVPAQDFQAPFQASVNVDSLSQGWSIIRDKAKESGKEDTEETTLIPIATTSEFDIENFKPQLIGGFKPIYSYPDDVGKKESEVSERQEKKLM